MLSPFWMTLVCLAPGQWGREADQERAPGNSRNALRFDDILVPIDEHGRASYGNTAWPGGIVPYAFDPSVTVAQQQITRDVMDEWEARADVSFVVRTTETDYVLIKSAGVNSSFVGKIGGPQDLNMFTWSNPIVLAHELSHALGFWHEQARADRDCYITVNYDNILPGFAFTFDVRLNGGDVGPYDFESMMHYETTAFSNCGPTCPTIELLPQYGLWESTLGQRTAISEGDARGAGLVYGFSATDANDNHIADSWELANGSPDCNNNLIPDDAETDCNGNGIPDDCDISQSNSFDLNLNQVPDECDAIPPILRVQAGANGSNSGATWVDAFSSLQDALTVAATAPGVVEEIWVAAGTYKPGVNREDSFELQNGLALYGGFLGHETQRSERSPDRHPSVLSGDVLGDDAPGFLNRADNSYNVVRASSALGRTALLDGFWIRGGCANGVFQSGGFFHAGGGIHLALDARPRVRRCVFTDNEAGAQGAGGGAYTQRGDPVFASCRFVGNRALGGGGLFADFSYPRVLNCVFEDNVATGFYGGGMAASHGGAWVANSTFYGNTAASFGGGYAHHSFVSPPGTSTLVNCILWNNTDQSGNGEPGQLSGNIQVNASCIQGWNGTLGGIGNFGLAPRFVNAAAGDFRLRRTSPCIDSGVQEKLPPDEGDLDDDQNFAEEIPLDFRGRPRRAVSPLALPSMSMPVIDRGAYEAVPFVKDQIPQQMTWN